MGPVSPSHLSGPTVSEPTSSAPPAFPRDWGSRRAAFFGGIRDVIGPPALVLGSSYIGFGSLARELDFDLVVALMSTLLVWALPAQVATVELYGAGAPLISIFIAVALINFRFLPMVVSLIPMIRPERQRRGILYLVAHIASITTWAIIMLRGGDMPRDQRLPYFFGGAGTLMCASLVGITIGYVVSGAVPAAVSYGFVFMNPLFFLLLLLADLRQRARILALVLGAIATPLLHLATPTWGLLLGGTLGGTLAFLFDHYLPKRRGGVVR